MNFDFVRPSTIAKWTFDLEDGSDSGPHGYHLHGSGSPPVYDLGRFGFFCSRYYGQNYLLAEYGLSTFAELANMKSASFWMKCNTFALQNIFGYIYNASGYTGYSFGLTSTGLLAFDSYDGYWDRVTSASQVLGSSWKWIVITRGDTYTSFYINGKLDSSSANKPYALDGREWTCVGAYWDMPSWSDAENYIGYLDELHIYNIELSHATISKMYAFQMGWL